MASTSHLVTIFVVCSCAMTVVFLPGRVDGGQLRETCVIGTNSLTIQETFTDENGGSEVTCRGTVTVKQCDGECSSKSTPSIMSATGFSKVCRCCREGNLVPKTMMLTDCTDDANNALVGVDYPVTVSEPDSCRCQPCSP